MNLEPLLWLSNLASLAIGYYLGARSKYLSDLWTDSRRNKEVENKIFEKFTYVRSQMPVLIKEMSEDLQSHPLQRKFLAANVPKGYVAGSEEYRLIYTKEHNGIDQKLFMLEEAGFIKHLGGIKYAFEEHFVKYLQINDK